MSSIREKLLLGGTVVVFAGATFLGTQMLFASTGSDEETETCEKQTVAAGEKLQTSMVTVNIYNSGNKTGLANRVRINMEKRGFLGGLIGNSDSEVKADNVTVLTENQEDPAVKLVAQQFNGEVQYAEPDIELEHGVTIILGSNYADLKKDAPGEIDAAEDITVCVPTIDLDEPAA